MIDTDRELLNALKEAGVQLLQWDCYAYNDEYEFDGEIVAYDREGKEMDISYLDMFGLQDIAYATFGDFTGRFNLNPQTGVLARVAEVYLPEKRSPVVKYLGNPEIAPAITREEAKV